MTLAEGMDSGESNKSRRGDVIIGDDFLSLDDAPEGHYRKGSIRGGMFSITRSPLGRKIITFNLIALNVLVAGLLFLNSSHETIGVQQANALIENAELVADVIEADIPETAPVNFATGDGVDIEAILSGLDLRSGIIVNVYDTNGKKVASKTGDSLHFLDSRDPGTTLIFDALSRVWFAIGGLFYPEEVTGDDLETETNTQNVISIALDGGIGVTTALASNGNDMLFVVTPIEQAGSVVGVVALSGMADQFEQIIRHERERVMQMFFVAILVSIGLSIVLASTIANPISDLAEAAELGRKRDRDGENDGRIRIPDLTARPDEIGRLSGALRGMVSALYERIESNEQFAADVAHEIKNPLASLRSAVGTLHFATRDDQRARLLEVIEHDVRRLDRLVSDISNASRLDSELVKEEQEAFNLIKMLQNLTTYLGQQAEQKGVEFISDMPENEVIIQGLEARLAQVFVNLITNATSFCEQGDAIRVWVRQRENRVLVVVEDTGPGIPDQALGKIFKRFYSQRPEEQFGNNSGLGLSISKQIVEAHGGVIWAENIRPTDADITSEPLGARFVVGLPV